MYKMASFFAGVGGIDLGFEQTKKFKIIYANEFDAYAVQTFKENFSGIKVDTRDIRTVDAKDIPDFDILLAGFPCQAFSIAGKQEGFNDEKDRGNLFFELIRIMKEKEPRIAFFENVKNLASHDGGNTFHVICTELDKTGYKYTYKVLNAKEYGNIPQNRERIYIIAFKDIKDYEEFKWPEKTPLTTSVRNIIDYKYPVDEKYYYTKDKYKTKGKDNINIYDALRKAVKDDNKENPSIYQWRRVYVRKNQSGVVPTLTANQGEGGHNVCLIHTDDDRIRKMTPRECFNTQGFPKDFKLPENLSDARLYKQAGNSVCVPVIKRIAERIVDALE